MGYYVTLTDADFALPESAEVLDAIKRMDTEWHDLKRGGSFSSQGKTDSWFSWMPSSLATFGTVAEVFAALGFDLLVDSGAVILQGYDNKTGQEELFLAAVAPFVEEGSYTEWNGEDGSRWRYIVKDGQLNVQEIAGWTDPAPLKYAHYEYSNGKSTAAAIDLYSSIPVSEQVAAARKESE